MPRTIHSGGDIGRDVNGAIVENRFVLGLGTIAKWTPALAFVAPLLWLLRWRRFDRAGVHLVGFAIPLLLVNVPLLLWRPSELMHAYTTQSARTVTAESFVYLPLHLFWDAEPGYWYFCAADVPAVANQAAIWFEIAVVVVVIGLATLARTRSAAVALAGLAPACFFPDQPHLQCAVLRPRAAAIIVASALVVRNPQELLVVIAALCRCYDGQHGALPVCSGYSLSRRFPAGSAYRRSSSSRPSR